MTDLIPVTPEMIETLLSHRDRTGMGAARLLRGRKDRPDGLNSATLHSILHTGRPSVRRDHYDYILALYEQADEKIEVTPELRERIEQEVARTGKSVSAVMRSAEDAPASFSASKARKIYYGEIRSAFRGEVEFLLSLYRGLPDRTAPPERRPEQAHADGRTATRILPLALPVHLFDHLTSAFPLMGCTSRIEYLRHLIRQDRLSPRATAEFGPFRENPPGEECGKSLNLSLPPVMEKWIEDRAAKIKLAPQDYIRALIALDRNNFS